MSRLPFVSGRQAVKAFERLGWRFVRQKGSHMALVKAGNPATLGNTPRPGRTVGTLRG